MLHFLFPRHCIVCDRYGTLLCKSCKRTRFPATLPECYKCRRLSNNYMTCKKCKEEGAPLDQVIVLWKYTETSKQLITQYKYSQLRSLRREIYNMIFTTSIHIQTDVLIPIPLSKTGYKNRGYNQTEIISEAFSNKCGIPTRLHELLRHTQNINQSTKDKISREREDILFEYTGSNREVCIIDDVITTGSTLEQAAKACQNTADVIKSICLYRNSYRKQN